MPINKNKITKNKITENKIVIKNYIKNKKKSYVKKISQRKQNGGLRKYISLYKELKRTEIPSPLDDFIDKVYTLLKYTKQTNISKNGRILFFLNFGHYNIEISSTNKKLIIALHNISREEEYLHLTCFKSDNKSISYAHITFINNNKTTTHIYYNNDNVNSLLDLILICQEIYNAIFEDKKDPIIPINIKLSDLEKWRNYFKIYLRDFINCLEYIDNNTDIFPKILKRTTKLGVKSSRAEYITNSRTLSSNSYNKLSNGENHKSIIL